MKKIGVLTDPQVHLGDVASARGIRPGSAMCILHEDDSVDVIYSSHMLEHLDRSSARVFLSEAHRVLRTGGILRLAVPDLAVLVERYNLDRDADSLVEGTLLASEATAGIRARMLYLLFGNRNHLWMYDAKSLLALVEAAGFYGARQVAPGQTSIGDPGVLDLRERADESVYIEATKSPAAGTISEPVVRAEPHS